MIPAANPDQPTPETPDVTAAHNPINVYYSCPYNFYWAGVFIFVGAFACSGLTETVDRATSILLWTVYITGFLIILVTLPLSTFDQKQYDQNGNPFTVRRPLVGLRSCETVVPLQALEGRLCHTEGGEDPPCLHDGRRYGPAFLRI